MPWEKNATTENGKSFKGHWQTDHSQTTTWSYLLSHSKNSRSLNCLTAHLMSLYDRTLFRRTWRHVLALMLPILIEMLRCLIRLHSNFRNIYSNPSKGALFRFFFNVIRYIWRYWRRFSIVIKKAEQNCLRNWTPCHECVLRRGGITLFIL